MTQEKIEEKSLTRNGKISSICGKLLSIRGKQRDGTIYSLLVDTGAPINLIKEDSNPDNHKKSNLGNSFVWEMTSIKQQKPHTYHTSKKNTFVIFILLISPTGILNNRITISKEVWKILAHAKF